MERKCWYRQPDSCQKKRVQGCDDEYYYCSQDSENYHKLCDRVWNIEDKDLLLMTTEELERLEDDASVCVYMRKRSEALCIHPGCRDKGHSGAIKKIQNKIRIIKHAKYKKSIDSLFRKWLENPEDESIYDEYLTQEKISMKFPPIKNIPWENFFIEIAKENNIKYKVEHWGPEDLVFPNQWAVVAFLENGEEYASFSEVKEDAFMELCSDLVNVFCDDKKYRKTFWESFRPTGWTDYKTGETVGALKKQSENTGTEKTETPKPLKKSKKNTQKPYQKGKKGPPKNVARQ